MKKILTLLAVLFWFSNAHSQINLASGVSGTITGAAQSFNETRGVDVNVISPTDLPITSMTLHRFFSGSGDTAYVGARIYNPSNGMLLASNMVSVYNIVNGAVSVPISYTLVSGMSYRISFFCGGPNPPTHNSAAEFQPSSLPYNEGSNLLEITHAYAYPADTFPVTTNIFVPIITLNLETSGINGLNFNEQAKIFPNPSTQNFTIELGAVNSQKADFRLMDVNGKIVPVKFNLEKNTILVCTEGLPKGMYFYQIFSDQKNVNSGKLVLE